MIRIWKSWMNDLYDDSDERTNYNDEAKREEKKEQRR